MKILNILKSRFINHAPFILTHQITSLCNARCELCDNWTRKKESRYDLAKDEIFKLIENAKNSGIIAYSAWCAETLLRKDLPEILEYAKQNKLMTSIYTNGYYLEKKYKEISQNLDLLFVSLDSNDKLHNEMRRVNGMREKAINGIKKCKEKTNLKVIINTVICNRNLDKIDGLVKLSKELDVPISFEPMHVNPLYNKQFQPTTEELKKAFSKIIQYKKSGHKIINSLNYLNNFSVEKSFVCHYPKIFIDVDAHGNIFSCLDHKLKKNWGNAREIALMDIFKGKDFKEFCNKREKCNKCNISTVIESSIGYSLNPLSLLEKIPYLI